MLFNANGSVTPTEESALTEESLALIIEASLFDVLNNDEIQAFTENHTEVQAARRDGVVLEKTIVRLDKQAKITHAQRMAVFTIAKEKNDPEFKKLVTVWRMERALEDRLNRKYGTEALRRARAAVNKGSQSKSAVVKRAAEKVKSQLGVK